MHNHMGEILNQFSDPTKLGVLFAIGLTSLFFGLSLKVSDLIQEHGYSWFRGGALTAGCMAAGFVVGVLALGSPDLSDLWVAVLLTWIVRGRIDGINHGVMAAAILGFLWFQNPQIVTTPHLAGYFLLLLLPLGVLHDALQYTEMQVPDYVRWFFRHQHLYWYLLGLGYLVFFSRNLEVPVSVYAFVKGYGFFYHGERDSLLRRLGIIQEGSAGELVGEESPEEEVHPAQSPVGE